MFYQRPTSNRERLEAPRPDDVDALPVRRRRTAAAGRCEAHRGGSGFLRQACKVWPPAACAARGGGPGHQSQLRRRALGLCGSAPKWALNPPLSGHSREKATPSFVALTQLAVVEAQTSTPDASPAARNGQGTKLNRPRDRRLPASGGGAQTRSPARGCGSGCCWWGLSPPLHARRLPALGACTGCPEPTERLQGPGGHPGPQQEG